MQRQLKFLKTLFDAIPAPIFYRDKNRNFQGCSLAYTKIMGQKSEEIIGKTVYDIYPEEYAVKIDQKDLELFDHPGTQTYETKLSYADGSVHDSIVSKATYENEKGELGGLVGVFLDITDRKHAEDKIQEQYRFLKTLFDVIPFPFYNKDKDSRYLGCSPSYAEIIGFRPEDITGKRAEDIFPDDISAIHNKTDQDLFQNPGTQVYEYRLEYADGTMHDHIVSKATYQDADGNLAGMLGFYTDITDRKRAEEELQEQYRFLKTLFDAISFPVFYKDIKGIYLGCSPAYTRIIGLSPEEVVGKTLYDVFPKEIADNYEQKDRELFAGPGEQEYETSVTHTDGSVHDTIICKATYSDAKNKIAGLVGGYIDITDRKQMEEERDKLQIQLMQSQKMEALGTLGGGIAHDFNNILMGIQGRVSLMLADVDSDEPFYEHLKGIEEYVKSATDLTRQLLGFARGGKYEVKPTDMNGLIRKSAGMFGRTKKELQLIQKFQEKIWAVSVDQGQFEQVFLNLFVNAWQAMPAGGELYIRTENVELMNDDVKSYQIDPGRYVKISVTDTGVGMDASTCQRIFDPFFTTRDMGRGTGLGLASTYGIVKNHGGYINVYSEVGIGTTFNIYLPVSGETVVKDKSSDKTDEILRGEETVLLVDDEQMIIDVGHKVLERLGYTVLTARGGQEAVRCFQENKDKIDLVILDLIMPDQGGSETYDMLKKLDPKIKVLLSSGYSINGQAVDIMKRGCEGFIQKPFNMKELSEKIRLVLDKK
ncbi:PAS domain S-box protein [Thermodesulfobacteriota bacterium]